MKTIIKNNEMRYIFVPLIMACILCLSVACNKEKQDERDDEGVYHRLDDYLPLRYCDGIDNQDDIDSLLAGMIFRLWARDADFPIADFYWQWAQDVTAMIDSIQESKGIFCDSVLNPYDKAIDLLNMYVDGGDMNYEMIDASYVYAAINLYKVHKQNIEFAERLDYVDMRDEYRLYNQYMKALEDYERRVDDAHECYYSLRPMVDNIITAIRCEQRSASMSEMIDVTEGRSRVTAAKPRPTRQDVMAKYHEGMDEELKSIDGNPTVYATDTLGMYLLQWVAYRDSVANLMPTELGRSYKNQTTNIIHDFMTLERPSWEGYE